MTTEALQSAAITGYDASPMTKPVAGSGAPVKLLAVSGYVTTSAGMTTGSTFQLVRLKSNCRLKQLWFESAADGGDPAYQLGASYSDSTVDGTAKANQGVVIDVDVFNTDIDNTSAIVPTDYINSAGDMNIVNRQKALWDALGLSTDPGGFIDIVLTSTATNTNGALLGVTAIFTEAN